MALLKITGRTTSAVWFNLPTPPPPTVPLPEPSPLLPPTILLPPIITPPFDPWGSGRVQMWAPPNALPLWVPRLIPL